MTTKPWRVRITLARVVEVDAASGAEAEEKARDETFFQRPIGQEDIEKIDVVWLDKETATRHVDGCVGNHCYHYDCDDEDEDYHEYCWNCDPEQDVDDD